MTLHVLTKACFLLCVATEFAGLSVKARVLAFINHLHRSRVTSADNTVVLKELALGECVVSIATTCNTTLTGTFVLSPPVRFRWQHHVESCCGGSSAGF